jgi:protocatechuate 3,4-dioxygenase beta subunit
MIPLAAAISSWLRAVALAFAPLMLLVQGTAQSIQGIVVKAGTNEPLAKAVVELHTDQDNPALDGPTLDRATTDDDGRFAFSVVRPGRYRILVARRGYYLRSPGRINVASGQATPEVRLAMNATGAISGRVFDANGQPLGNVQVQAMKATYPAGRRALTLFQTTVTNDLGEYRLFWLPPGRYFVSAGDSPARNPAAFAPVYAFNLSFSSDPAVPDLGLIERQRGESGAPTYFGGTLDEDAATGIDLRAAAEFKGADIMVLPTRAYHVRGTIVDRVTGRPPEYASVRSEMNTARGAPDRADANRDTGAFDVVLSPGKHALRVQSASGTGYILLSVSDTDIDGLTIGVMPDFDIHGRVAIEGPQVDKSALGSLRITLRRDSPFGDPITTTYSNPLPDGSLTVSAAAGDFRFNIAPILNVAPVPPPPKPPALQNAYVKSIRMGDVDALNGSLRLDRATQTPLEIVIGGNPGALNGRVVAPNAASGSDITVVLLPEVRRRTDLYRTTLTEGAGQFQFDRLPPGDYKVFAWEAVDDDAWFDPEFMKMHEDEGVPVRVVEGRTQSVEVNLNRR